MRIYQIIIIALGAFLVVSCGSMQQSAAESPTEVIKKLVKASKTKDVETIKKSITKDTLNFIDGLAKSQNSTADEVLRKSKGLFFIELPEMRNEKIEGDTATVEIRNVTPAMWITVSFVKEGGSWRIAIDKYLKDLEKISLSIPPPTPPGEVKSESSGSKQPGEAANKTANSKK